MSGKSIIVFMVAVCCAVFVSMTILAAENDPITVSGILKNAGMPLSEEQTDVIAAMQPDGKLTERLGVVYKSFSGDQLKVLRDRLGNTAEAARDEGKSL